MRSINRKETREIGGYLEMEEFLGKEYYSGLHKLNLARTSFVWLLRYIDHKRIFLPEYLCDTVNESAKAAGHTLVPYRLNKSLHPVWGKEGEPAENDILYLVNYYGQLSEDDIISYRDTYSSVIVDNAQAFYDRPVQGVHTIYSVRKFFGVPDGAYVATDLDINTDDLERDHSEERVRYLVGRLEKTAQEFYGDMRAADDAFSTEIPRRMSLFTENMLKGIDYEAVRLKRCANYQTLSRLLPSNNPFNRIEPVCPFAYPFYHEDGVRLRKYLVEHKIYIPTLWSFLIDDEHDGTLEKDWSENILSLPIDQRYDAEDMEFIADTIRSFG